MALLDFLLPEGVGPTPTGSSGASPDLDLALDGFKDTVREGLIDTSFEDDGPAGTTVNSGGALEGAGLA